MAEVYFDDLFEVTMIEYDEGCQRIQGRKFFTEKNEAKEFCEDYSSGNRSCYYRATYRKIR